MAILKFDATQWIDWIKSTRKGIKLNKVKILERLGRVAIKGMQSKLPAGNLRTSIGNPAAKGIYEFKSAGDTIILRVGTAVPYSVYVNRGIARFYPITTKQITLMEGEKRALAFYWEKIGRVAYFKKVKHPPVKGKFYLEFGHTMVTREMLKIAETGGVFK